MAKASATDQAHVVLAVGKEAILVQRVIEGVMASARKADPAAVRQDIVASNESAAGELANALSPSLFGELTVIVVQGIDGATDDVGAILLTAISELPEHVRLVITHPGGVKGKKLLDTIRKANVLEAACGELKAKDLEAALIAEFRRHNRKATAGAISALQVSIGSGLGELLAAVSQLCADTEADVIDEVEVSQYYAGVVGVMGWDLSDAMWNAQPVELLEKFRWAMTNDSNAAVPAVSAISSGLRSLIKYASAPANMSENELAPLVGVPPWKLRFLRAQKAKWHPDQLAAAARLLALADRSSKGTVYDVAIPGGRSLESSQTLYHMEKEFMAIRAPKD
jgi:DNA polymerase III subunit delta